MSNQPTYHAPPEWVMRWLRWYCDPSFLEEIEGDLFELFQEEVDEFGLPKAQKRFLWIALRYLNPYFFGKKDLSFNLEYHLTMLRHYLKIGLRHLWKQRLYSFINIAGLAIGIACCVTVLYFVIDELGYDDYHENSDRLYRLSITSVSLSGGEEQRIAVAPILWGPNLKKDYPEVEDYARFVSELSPDNPWILNVEDLSFAESDILFADPSALKLFNWPMLYGDPDKALNEPGTIVLTKEMALKYFNEENVVGKTITLDPKMRGNDGQLTGQKYQLKVTGVLEDIPRSSHFTFDFLIPSIQLNLIHGFDINGNGENARWYWRGLIAHTYLKLKDPSVAGNLESKFEEFQNRYLGDDTRSRGYYYKPFLQNIKEIYLGGNLLGQLQPVGSKTYILVFSIVAFFILCIACINFMNLATARAATRAQEVGMRKVVGAKYGQLIKQFIGESFLITFFALILALSLARFILPIFYNYLEKQFYFNYANLGPFILGLVLLSILVALISGSYPAFFLSKYKPVQILKGNFIKSKKGGLLRKSLVVFQFLLSAVLIITTLTLIKQMNYMRDSQLGFDKEHVLVVQPNTARSLADQYEAIKTELEKDSKIKEVTMASAIPGFNFGGDIYAEKGKPVESSFGLSEMLVDYNYIDFFKLKLVAGRNFSQELSTDKMQPPQDGQPAQVTVILNREAVKQFGWLSPEEAIGKQIVRDPNARDFEATVIGVMEDFHLETLMQEISPLALILLPRYSYLAVKLEPGNISESIASIEKQVASFAPNAGFEYQFLDDAFNDQYQLEQQLSKTFGQVSFLAILIACMGLFGLAAFSTSQRVKEIGIRKTFGASIRDIVLLLSKDFAKLVLIAVGIAIPISYYLTEMGLDYFAYRISDRIDVYLLVLVLALIVALFTVSFHTLKAALSNPVSSLRSE